ncbi:Enolase [Frankliniella fusca]|uniref:Enolase n=1 Tax=Frankliniella fusca TaxID=407009 RepID=A0AAE1HBT8_9NEOP|nr:Enolase [Frankliniella fusca]
MLPCSICVKSFPSVNSLQTHLELEHPLNITKVMKCRVEGCLRLLSNWKVFRRHMIRDHKFPVKVHGVKYVSHNNQAKIDVAIDMPEFNNDMEEDVSESENLVLEPRILKQTVLSHASSFVTKFYANPRIPRSHVQDVVQNVKVLLQDVVSHLMQPLTSLVNDSTKVEEEKELAVKNLLDSVLEPFENTLSTEYKRFKYLRSTGNFIEAEDYIVGDRVDHKFSDTRVTKKRVSVKGKYVPMKKILTKFFDLPGVFIRVKSYVDYLEVEVQSGIISNFMQCKLWKLKSAGYYECGKFVLPIFLYFDDFECGNPLGPHAGVYKLGAVYFSMPFLPPEFQTVFNVFLTLLFHASDRSVPEDGNYYVFRKLIDDLNELAKEGIEVKVDGKSEKIYFIVVLLLADNLGFNQILGFAGSFSANFYCRFCKSPKDELECMLREDKSSLRKISDYESDVDKGLKMTGINENSVWNSLLSFHVYENFSVDILHDFFLGVCKTDMGLLLNNYICVEKYFTVDDLNSRICSFNYTINGFHNKPACIVLDDVKECKVSMTGIELYNFILLFPFFVCDFLKPDVFDSALWSLYLTLRGMLDIVTAKSFQKECIKSFESLVSEHHSIRVKELHCTLKPKDHFLLHYPTVMLFSGPIANLSTAQFESKHRKLKTIADSSSSRVFISHTIAVKEQLGFCYRLESEVGLDDKFEAGPSQHFPTSLITNYYLFCEKLPEEFREVCSLVPWVNFKGITYYINSFVAIENVDLFPVFAKIVRIFLSDEHSVCFLLKPFKTIYFHENLHAYEITETSLYQCMYVKDLAYPFLVIHQKKGLKCYITLRQML